MVRGASAPAGGYVCGVWVRLEQAWMVLGSCRRECLRCSLHQPLITMLHRAGWTPAPAWQLDAVTSHSCTERQNRLNQQAVGLTCSSWSSWARPSRASCSSSACRRTCAGQMTSQHLNRHVCLGAPAQPAGNAAQGGKGVPRESAHSRVHRCHCMVQSSSTPSCASHPPQPAAGVPSCQPRTFQAGRM